jgi:hypothetical protein
MVKKLSASPCSKAIKMTVFKPSIIFGRVVEIGKGTTHRSVSSSTFLSWNPRGKSGGYSGFDGAITDSLTIPALDRIVCLLLVYDEYGSPLRDGDANDSPRLVGWQSFLGCSNNLISERPVKGGVLIWILPVVLCALLSVGTVVFAYFARFGTRGADVAQQVRVRIWRIGETPTDTSGFPQRVAPPLAR